MSAIDPCSTWFGRLGLVAWQFLQSPEGGRTIAAVGGVLFILYYLKEGAVPAGRLLAGPLAATFVAYLSAVVLLSSSSWDQIIEGQCTVLRYELAADASRSCSSKRVATSSYCASRFSHDSGRTKEERVSSLLGTGHSSERGTQA
jgi:hypothetical protein